MYEGSNFHLPKAAIKQHIHQGDLLFGSDIFLVVLKPLSGTNLDQINIGFHRSVFSSVCIRYVYVQWRFSPESFLASESSVLHIRTDYIYARTVPRLTDVGRGN